MKELAKAYCPQDVEDKIYSFWNEKGLCNAEVNPSKKPYCIVIPPPNITGILHMGHALNNTIQDILIRHKRMQGYEALWLPGTDHAGIATQNVVERKLAKERKKRHDIGREKFVAEVWRWQKEYGGTIIKQLKRLGASCDWRREKFTMDESLSNAVLEVFIRLYNKGLIYRGNYIINWCPRCQTALSDEEVQHRELDGHLYYIRYPLKKRQPGLDYIIVATTRPETMLGDTAVAVSAKDERYTKLIGEIVVLPILNRELTIIADDFVDPAFGTGIVKVTPAHDPNDFLIAGRHGIEAINIMNPDGTLNDNAGDYAGMDRMKAREALLADLKERSLIEKIEPHTYAVGHCYRCHTIVEPYLSRQWFVKMRPLAQPAIEAVEKGRITFYPKRWTKVYLDWMYNIKDWCISRQIWWGHRIPVYYCTQCQGRHDDQGIIASKVKPQKCPKCGSVQIVQDEDVLDTWFSSWLWPFSTFGWPFTGDDRSSLVARRSSTADKELEAEKELAEFRYFYPTSSLVTAQEIIFFWVARMIMAGIEFCHDIPFKDVYIHGTVRDESGTKMSKSLGNIIDPIEIIEHYGADALRFSIISMTSIGQDVFLSKDKFEMGRNFANKIWNVSRFLLMNLKEDMNADLCTFIEKAELSLADRWILSALYRSMESVNDALESYRLSEAANILYEFIWHKYCDWYVEIAKDSITQYKTQLILFKVLEKSLRMLHPFMPFVTEELWGHLDAKEPIMVSPWPHVQEQMIDLAAEKVMEQIIEIIVAVRNIRAEMGIEPKQEIDISVSYSGDQAPILKKDLKPYARRMAGVKAVTLAEKITRPKLSASAVLNSCEVYIPLEGIIDIQREKARLSRQIEDIESGLSLLDKKLANTQFVDKAPADIVDKEREKQRVLKDRAKKLKESIANLS